MNKVAVLMSSYNGEKYIREQIDSILDQQGVEVILFVRDDGSSDGTKDILSAYETEHANVKVEYAQNVGVANSFMNLLYSVSNDFDFYAFSDQDDIWEPNKLSEAVKMLEEKDALLYGSNQECVDQAGQHIGMRYATDAKINMTPIAIVQNNMIAGCTMVFTSKLYKLLTEEIKRPSQRLLRSRMHDVWAPLVAAVHGGLIYDTRSFIKYRQHENNVVGAQISAKKRRKAIKRKLFNKENRNSRSLTAKEICEKFPDEAKKDYLLEVCANAHKLKNKRLLIKNNKLLRSYTGESKTGFIIKVLLGLY
ncbi:MAG: glycosyltransferase [Clostridiales bacterium]|nr:glycosyltransferase [Clostridiales bacterium]